MITNKRGFTSWWKRCMRCINPLILIFLFTLSTHASDLMEVSPVTNKILMVFIKDGHIDTYGVGQSTGNNVTYVNATNLTNATNKANYVVTSTDDGNYTTAKNPLNLGRKSKALEYNDEWQSIPYVWGHWIYIELPNALIQGKTYTVTLNNIVENKNSVSFVYDVNRVRSETVHVNMVGFPQSGPKYAYLSQWMGDFNTATHASGGLNLSDKAGAQFRLINYATGATAFTGTISSRMTKSTVEAESGDFPGGNLTKADVWQCDFSSFTTPGEYVVAVDGIGCSYPFEINNAITREPFYYAMKGLFWQRQGIVKEITPGKIMPRDHHPNDITWKWDKNWAGSEDNSGFNTSSPRVYGIYGYYHDAGDWDGYVHHAKVPMSLLLLYDLAPDKFYDGEVGNKYKLAEADANWINEGTNGIPDLLDEAVWLINYYKRARTTLQSNYGGTGGVPGYVGRDAINGNNYTAWQDTREWYLSAENVEQTFYYSGLAAWYAVCLNKFHQLTNSGNHPEYTSWVNEATAAWNWANGKTLSTDNDRRAKGFAAANMYRATANTTYQTAFQDYYNWEPSKGDGEWSNPNIFDVAASVYALIPAGHSGLNSTLQNTVKTEIQTKALNTKVNNINANGYRCGLERYQFIQLGGLTTPKLTLLPVAYKLTGDVQYLDAIKNVSNYVLGGNQLNMTYLSGLGERSDVWIFNPNGYLINDFNSKVYQPEVNIGYTSYFGATGGVSGYWFYNSQFSEYFSRTAAYPQAKDFPTVWPGAEQKFFNRYSIQGGEFTIHQQNNYMIYTMGYVKAMSNTTTSAYSAPSRPTVSLIQTEGQAFAKTGCDLTVTASANVRSVKYYYDWHYIGESYDKANNFRFYWVPPQANGTSVLVTAVGYSDKGIITLPTDAGDRNITISTSATCGTPVTYTLTTNATNGSVTRNPNQTSYASGTNVTLTATANSGYTFSGWSGDASGTTNPLTITMNSNKNITANFTANPTNYTLTINATNGSVTRNPNQTSYASGTSVTLTATANSGYTFSGWSGDASGTTNPLTITMNSNKNITANFTAVPPPTGCLLTNPSFESDLQAWQINSGTIAISTDATNGTKSARLYGSNAGMEQGYTVAVAQGTTVTVSFDAKIAGSVGWAGVGLDFKAADGTDLLKPNLQITNTSWQSKTIVANAPAGTARLNVWAYTSSGELYVDNFCISGVSEPEGFTLTTNATNGTVTRNPNQASYASGTSVTLTATANSGYTFSGWSGDASGTTNPLTITMNSDKNITANFTANPVGCDGTGTISLLRYEGISGTAVSNLTGAAKYPNSPDYTATLTSFEAPTNILDNYGLLVRGYICPPTTGNYTFWIAGDDGVELWLSTSDNPANKARIAYHTAWTNSREWNKYATQKSAAIALTAGTRYYVEALMKEGSGGDNLAVGWLKPGQTGTSPSEVIPGSALIPYATAPVTYTLTTNATNGSVTRNPNQTSYASGTSVTLTATANSGYTFSGWSGDASGTTNPLTLTMNSDKNITANFSANPVMYTLTTNATNGSVTRNPNQASYASGTSVTLTATANSGYTFSGWSGDASGTTNPLTITMNSDKNITANFTANPVGCDGTGTISLLRYEGISGTAVSNLTGAAKYPNSPDYTTTLTSFEAPTNILDNYGLLVRGYICPPTTGNYTFWIAGDDGVELWLSTSDNPANKARIAYHTAWTNSREWNKYATQKSAAIALTAGTRYYVEALMKEGSGGDNLAVGWLKPGQTGTSPSEVIPGSALIPYASTPAPVTGLTHQWLFNSNANDQIGTANGTLVNSVTYNTSTKKEGTASVDFTSSNANGYVNVGNIDLTNTFTITLWAYNQGTRLHQNYLIANSSDGQSNAGFVLWVNDYNSTNGKIVLRHDDGPSDAWLTSSTGAFPMNQWNHLALTVDNNTHVAVVYVNGVQVSSGTIKTIGVNHELWIGQMWSQVWNGWGGYIDDVRTYNQVLSASEVSNLYNSTKVGETIPVSEPLASGVMVYPNPVSNGLLNIRFGKMVNQALVTVYTLQGIAVKQASISLNDGLELELTDVKQGMYLIDLRIDNERIVKPISVK